MRRYNLYCLFILCLFLFQPLIAMANVDAHSNDIYQDDNPIEIKGSVTDEEGIPLPGVTVKIKGKSLGIHTDSDGLFLLYVSVGTVVEFSYLGMQQQSVVIKSNKYLRVVMQSESKELGETIITGFNQTTSRRTTGSVATVDVSRLTKDSPLKSIDQLIQGQVAGVSVSAVSGRPGESAKIRIRGISTITGNEDPLWVIDGVPLQKGADIPVATTSQIKSGDFSTLYRDGIAGINPRDIENITILKDASATAIYGSQGGNGVIVVTTKRGKAGRMAINYSSNLVLQSKPQRDANLMNSQEKLAFEQELWNEFSAEKFSNNKSYPVVGIVGAIRSGYGAYNGLSLSEQDALINQLGEESTDWFDILFRNSLSQSHNLSLSGGSDKNTYYVSLGYTGNTGIVKKTDSESYNASLKLNTKVNDKLSIEFDTDISYLTAGGSAGSVDPFRFAYFANPYEKPYNDDGTYSSNDTYINLPVINNNSMYNLPPNGYNIMRDINETSSETKAITTGIRTQLSYNINDDFRLSGLMKYSYTSDESDNIVGRYTYAAWLDRPFETSNSKRTYGSISQTTSSRSSIVARAQLSYNKYLTNTHRISALGGAEVSRNYSKALAMKRYGYDPLTGNSSIPIYVDPGTGKIDYNQLIAYGAIVDGLMQQNISEDRLASFFFAADYNILERYIFSGSFRTDGSSNFGSKQQFNPTGSVGLAWNADQEDFIKRLNPIISSLAFRVSTGYTGNINRRVYPQLMLDYSNTFRKTYDDYYRMGSIRNAPNKNLRWEKVFDYKGAMNIGVFSDRLRLLVEAYVRKTKDAVSSLGVTSTTGFNTQSFNNAEMENKGLEFTFSSSIVKTKDFTWNATANIGYNVNKLTKYETISGALPAQSGNFKGYPKDALYSGKLIGVDPVTGIYKFEIRPDASPVTDSELRDAANYVFYLGTSNAPITGGFSTNVDYKNFSLNIGGAYSINRKVYNDISAPDGYSKAVYGTSPQSNLGSLQKYDLYIYHFNTNKDAINRWTVDNPRTDANPRIVDMWDTSGTPIFYQDNPVNYNIMRGALLENVSYLKITNISLSYNVPDRIYKAWGISNVNLVVSMSNIFTFTNYTGIDPETPGAVYPQSRSYSFGLSLSL